MEHITKRNLKSLSFLRVERNTHRTLFSGIAKLRIGGCLKLDAGEWKGKGTYTLARALGIKTHKHKDFKGKKFSVRKLTNGGQAVTRSK